MVVASNDDAGWNVRFFTMGTCFLAETILTEGQHDNCAFEFRISTSAEPGERVLP